MQIAFGMNRLRLEFSNSLAAGLFKQAIDTLSLVNESEFFDFINRLPNDEQEFFFKNISHLEGKIPDKILVRTFENGLRTNSLKTFVALAVDNPFAQKFLSDPQFNQMVLKAVFNNLDVQRIKGILQRFNVLLIKQLQDYKQERLSANRELQESLTWLLEQPQSLTQRSGNHDAKNI